MLTMMSQECMVNQPAGRQVSNGEFSFFINLKTYNYETYKIFITDRT